MPVNRKVCQLYDQLMPFIMGIKVYCPIFYHYIDDAIHIQIQNYPQKQNLGNFIKNVGQWDKLPKCRTNVGQNCKMWEMWECGTSVQPDYRPFHFNYMMS